MTALSITIPENVKIILECLNQSGFEAFIVGGCVRDSLLGKPPKDWDITTSAHPEQVKALFSRTIDTGIAHGTVTVMMDKEGYEVTTYRVDGEYEDCRHPKNVEFTDNLIEDLKRRDFTINAMAYSPMAGLIDAFDGVGDLKRRIIRCVGVARERFEEDALRIMRAVRFSAQLAFDIEAETQKAMTALASNLVHVSAERIQMEMVKLLISDHPERIHTAYELGVTAVVLPEYDHIVGVEQHTPNHIYTVEVHTLEALMHVEKNTVLRLTMLMHDFGKPDVKETLRNGQDRFYRHPEISAVYANKILRRLKFDNFTRERVVRLVKWHGLKYTADPASVRRALNRVGADIFEDFIRVQHADISAKNPAVIPEKLALLEHKVQMYHQIMGEGQCFSIRQLAVNGRDLLAAGVLPGPAVGAVLEKLTEAVIDDQSLNTREKLLEMAAVIKDSKDLFVPKVEFF